MKKKGTMEEALLLTCGCCGKGIYDTKDNIHFGMTPYPDDIGFGMCRECGGDDSITNEEAIKDEKAFKKKLGWGGQAFFESRFDIVQRALTDKEKWKKLPYRKKVAVITQFIEKGFMI